MKINLFKLLGQSENDFLKGKNLSFFGKLKKKVHVDSFHLISDSTGLEFLFELDEEDYFLDTIFIDSDKLRLLELHDLLDVPVDFNDSRSDIRKLLGKPSFESKLGDSTLIGKVTPWDKYRVDGYYVHFKFGFDSNSIEMVTLSV
jgi:hypothetical protein